MTALIIMVNDLFKQSKKRKILSGPLSFAKDVCHAQEKSLPQEGIFIAIRSLKGLPFG